MVMVVPMAGVHAFAEALRTAQPARSVDVAEISAPHCQLAKSEPRAYEESISKLIERVERRLAEASATSAESVATTACRGTTADPGTDEATGDAPMLALIASVEGIALDADALASRLSLDAALRVLSDEGRPALLEALKIAGVAKLPERQKVVNALSKMHRARAE